MKTEGREQFGSKSFYLASSRTLHCAAVEKRHLLSIINDTNFSVRVFFQTCLYTDRCVY